MTVSENVATRMKWVCEKCGTELEALIPYHFPDGSRFPWDMEEVRHPYCPMEFSKYTGYPSEHVMQWKKTARVKKNER